MIGAVVVSDRGDLYLPGCLNDVAINIGVPVEIIDDAEHRLGMAGAVRAAWKVALDEGWDYLFHVEEDFRFNYPVPLRSLVSVLELNPHLAQVVLKRQPWNAEEKAAGGIIEANPTDYVSHRDGDLRWVEHDRIFSLNPCLIPRRVLEMGWPDTNEAGFTEKCRAAGLSFAFYGSRDDPPLVTHVGEVRGTGWRL